MTSKNNKKPLSGIKVVLVEDDDFLAEILKTKLVEDGGILNVFNNALVAFRFVEQNIPDVIITDLMLPGMPGEELVEKIKLDKRLKHIPLIVFSNKNNPQDIKKILEIGASEYHVKAETSLKDIPKIIERGIKAQSSN